MIIFFFSEGKINKITFNKSKIRYFSVKAKIMICIVRVIAAWRRLLIYMYVYCKVDLL